VDSLLDSRLTKRQVRQRQRGDSDSEHSPQWHNDGDMRGKVDESSCRIWVLFCVVFMYNDYSYSNSFET